MLFTYADNWTCNIPCGCVCYGSTWSMEPGVQVILILGVLAIAIMFLMAWVELNLPNKKSW